MRIVRVEALGFRNLSDGLSLDLTSDLTVLHGANGSGKTNLLDAIHFGLTGASIRSGSLGNAIRFGSDVARVEVFWEGGDGTEHSTFVSVDRKGERRNLIDGSAPSPSVPLPQVSVFHPDLLQMVKGPPAFRRSFLDQVSGSLAPSRRELRKRYGRTLAQRNAQVRRVRAGEAVDSSLDVWDARLAEDAVPLIESRTVAWEAISEPFADIASRLGLDAPLIAYRPRATGDQEEIGRRLVEMRSETDLGRGYLMFGPHLDDMKVTVSAKSLKQFGSQGQQRAAVLSLLLAERLALGEAGQPSPLLVLDDVMSELDPRRRQLLMDVAVEGGQTVITATELGQVPLAGMTSGLSSSHFEVEVGNISTSASDSRGLEDAA